MNYRDRLLPVYLDETREHIEAVSNLLVDLEHDPGNEKNINEIFRRAHTIKGGAATVGFVAIGEVAHRFENVLDDVRSSRLALSKEVFSVLFETADILKQLLEAAGNGAQPQDIQILADKLNGVAEYPNSSSSDIALRCHVELMDSCTMKVPRIVVILKSLQRLGEIIATCPPEPILLQGEFDKKFHVDLNTSQTIEQISDAIAKVQDVETISITELNVTTSSTDAAQISPDNNSTLRRIYVRVDVMKLDNMINLIGELVIERNRLATLISEFDSDDSKSRILGRISAQLGRVTSELQKEIMSSRMVPISQIFNNLPRLARDTAMALDKDIQLSIQGEDTELDRTLVERLRDPMVHLLRNAIDHGIESPEARIDAGKPSAGHIDIKARHQDNNVVIEVSDDGRGINFLAVIKKVVAMGLMSAEQLQGADQEDLINLV